MLQDLVRGAVWGILAELLASSVDPVLGVVADSIVATPDLTGSALVQGLWAGDVVLANGLLVLLVVAGGFVVASRETFQTQTGLRELAPRIVLAATLVNCSLLIAREAITVTNALAAMVLGQGVDEDATAERLRDVLGIGPADTLGTLLGLVALVLLLVLVATYVVRVTVLLVLLVLAPLALVCHALPQTERLAAVWWRAFLACLGVQIVHAVLLLLTVRLLLTPDGSRLFGVALPPGGWLEELLLVALLWLMIRVPFYARQLVSSGGGRGVVSQVVRAYFLWRTVGRVVGGGSGAGRAKTSGGGRRGRGSGGSNPGGARNGPRRGPGGGPSGGRGSRGGSRSGGGAGSAGTGSSARRRTSRARTGQAPPGGRRSAPQRSTGAAQAAPRRSGASAPAPPPRGSSPARPAQRPTARAATEATGGATPVQPGEGPPRPAASNTGAAPRRRSREPRRVTWAEVTGAAPPAGGTGRGVSRRPAEWLPPPAPPRPRRSARSDPPPHEDRR